MGARDLRARRPARAGAQARLPRGVRRRGRAPLRPRRRRRGLLRGARRLPGGVSVHARRPSLDAPGAPLDDAPVRGLLDAGGLQRALPLSPLAGADRPVGRVRSAHANRLRLGCGDGRGRGRQGRRGDRLNRGYAHAVQRHSAGSRHHVDDDQLHRSDAALALCRGRRRAGRRQGQDRRYGPERHSQGVHRAGNVHLPARALDAADHRYVRLLHPRSAALEHDLDLRLPHARGGLHRRAGDRLHDRQRDRLRRSGAGGGPGLRRLRPAALVLLRLPLEFPRRGGQVPRGAAALGDDRPRAVRLAQRAGANAALPHADRRRHADCATA